MEKPLIKKELEVDEKPKLSKRKRKKIEKAKRWLERKDEFLELRRKKRKIKKIERKLRLKKASIEAKKLGIFKKRPNNRKLKLLASEKMKKSPVLIIDSAFENDLDEKSLNSLFKQYCHINALMKNNEKIFRVEVTGIQEKSQVLLKENDADKWIVHCFKEDYMEKLNNKIDTTFWGTKVEPYEFEKQNLNENIKDKLIYLTGDAEEEMKEIDER